MSCLGVKEGWGGGVEGRYGGVVSGGLSYGVCVGVGQPGGWVRGVCAAARSRGLGQRAQVRGLGCKGLRSGEPRTEHTSGGASR
jgi:hypothetical protein